MHKSDRCLAILQHVNTTLTIKATAIEQKDHTNYCTIFHTNYCTIFLTNKLINSFETMKNNIALTSAFTQASLIGSKP